jgi:hypothetical protein
MTTPTPPVVPAAAYQAEIYLGGLSGSVPPLPTDLTTLGDAARDRLEPGPYGYIAGGAGSGATMRANRAAFDRWRIVPRMLRETTSRRLARTVLGTELPAPVLVAPVGVLSIAHPDGELAVARAAAGLGVPMVLSTAASHTLEEVAEASGDGPRWFQLYWPTEDDVTVSLLNRARAAGYTPWTPGRWATGRSTWTRPTCRSCAGWAPRSRSPTPPSGPGWPPPPRTT